MKFTYAGGSRPLEGYTIKRGVGRGGFGEVYYATSDGGKEVALKLIRRNLDVELRGVSQCLNLKHPYLVGLYDIRQDEHGDSWVVMEYVSGESLEDIISRHPQGMPLPEMLAWMHGIGAGVAYLHDHGIVHRDLKPGNIFSDEGMVKIGDYGLSKFISASRRSGQTESVGTVHYMAPEVANGRYGKEIDIYALGIMLYEMLTGHVPFEGESVGEVLMKHLTAEPDLRPLNEPYRSLVGRALHKDPDQRLKSVAELLAALPKPADGALLLGASPVNSNGAAAAPAAAAASKPVLQQVAQAAAAIPGVAARAAADNEEPILRACQDGLRQLRAGWNVANIPQPLKVLIFVGAVILTVKFSPLWLPLGVMALVGYGGYRVVRAIVIPRHAAATAYLGAPAASLPAYAPSHVVPEALPVAVAVPSPPLSRAVKLPRKKNKKSERALPAMLVKTSRERVTELAGSMLLSAVVVAVLCGLMTLLLNTRPEINQLAWMGLVSTAGTWSLLIAGKFWEGTQGEPWRRRFVLLLVGLSMGALAYAADDLLLVELPWLLPQERIRELGNYQAGLADSYGVPNLKGFLAYFGFLFPVLRWWKQSDPLRWSRLSIWGTVVTVFGAWVLNFAWPFPQPWGMMIAGAMAISLQLSSPWIDHESRESGRLSSIDA